MARKPVSKKKMPCNKARRTPGHPKKSHIVKACKNGKEKIIRFGEQGASTAGKPKAGESKRMKKKHKADDKSTEVYSMLKLLRTLEQPKEKTGPNTGALPTFSPAGRVERKPRLAGIGD